MTTSKRIKEPAAEKPLYTSCACGREDEVDTLLAAGADVNAKSCGETALMRAAGRNNKSIVRKLLKAGARITDRDWKKRSALSWAATGGKLDPEMTTLLLEAGCPVDGRDLHVPITLRELEIVKLLLSKKPDVNARFDWQSAVVAPINKGDTPLIVAVDVAALEMFAMAGASFGVSRPVERLAIVDLLLAAGADVNIPRLKTGVTPLIMAAWFDEAEIAEKLIHAGADPKAEIECKLVQSPKKPRTLHEEKLSAISVAETKPKNKKIRKLLLGKE
jgi:ankyrin repeat protein